MNELGKTADEDHDCRHENVQIGFQRHDTGLEKVQTDLNIIIAGRDCSPP
jgi:hypothetical protein